ncbi:CDP-glucose 4,6-dehydratase [Paenibacillus sp. PastF-1]|nr:CDP-glucose 4,6-dehydratase [Paenibacillus sp. PastF-2]MDF9851575.1 CDP-glucose 4,6-dehydratase [Paenibacillus sp. PastM-2]MDF9858159.1 CDP-glucose 4,6-dehydratase [Paenibacillus sp. PastF-1]MDH6483385.1 CDP-glucose 4,6-dehydratase [Paenibacillus sp. PastH-2]MDH6510835.1 CDP-glucose 4,6-dehydratase [Paenibacillus sp. PastM-3]
MEIGECTMEKVDFWKNKKVFLTGHTGFKGTWLSIWLHQLGAKVTGYSTAPNTDPSLFHCCGGDQLLQSVTGDIRDASRLGAAMQEADPDIVFHLAAQPLVREAYRQPVDTYATNVLGTVHVLEAVRQNNLQGGSVKAVVNITTDKCYENKEWLWGYRENDPLGGFDPYSSSKACSELVTSSYRNSFFHNARYQEHGVAIASARAGNVIGGGDWAAERLIPDCFRAICSKVPLVIRSPGSVRPWQHVLEPLSGYLLLGQRLIEEGIRFAEPWNFGPDDQDARSVEWVVRRFCSLWGAGARYEVESDNRLHETAVLKLDCSKAKLELGWQPRWDLDTALMNTSAWYKAFMNQENMLEICRAQIRQYEESGAS